MGVRGPKTKNKTRLSLQRSLKDARKQQMFLQQTQTTNENSMQVQEDLDYREQNMSKTG